MKSFELYTEQIAYNRIEFLVIFICAGRRYFSAIGSSLYN